MHRDSETQLDAVSITMRAELRQTLSELRSRSTPTHLFHQVGEQATERGRKLVGDSFSYATKHGKIVALTATGALLAFDLGRRSASRPQPAAAVPATAGSSSPEAMSAAAMSASSPPPQPAHFLKPELLFGRIDLGSQLGFWFRALLSMALGSAVSMAIPVTEHEQALFGDTKAAARQEIDRFRAAHLDGARHTVAGAFGIARTAAWILGLLVVAAESLRPVAKAES